MELQHNSSGAAHGTDRRIDIIQGRVKVVSVKGRRKSVWKEYLMASSEEGSLIYFLPANAGAPHSFFY
jgi:hypothetical protein